MRPTFGSAEVSTARQVPCPAAMTNRKADSISMMVCRTSPAWKCCPFPWPDSEGRRPGPKGARCPRKSDPGTPPPPGRPGTGSAPAGRARPDRRGCPTASSAVRSYQSVPLPSLTIGQFPCPERPRDRRDRPRARAATPVASGSAWCASPPAIAAPASGDSSSAPPGHPRARVSAPQLRGQAGLRNPNGHPEMAAGRGRTGRGPGAPAGSRPAVDGSGRLPALRSGA